MAGIVNSLILNEQKLPNRCVEMSDKHRDKLQANHEKLLDQMELKSILPFLFARKALDDSVYGELLYENLSPQKQAERFLIHLRNRADMDYYFFCDAMKNVRQDWLFDLLVDEEDMKLWEVNQDLEQEAIKLDEERRRSEAMAFRLSEGQTHERYYVKPKYQRVTVMESSNEETALKEVDIDITSPKAVWSSQSHTGQYTSHEDTERGTHQNQTLVKEVADIYEADSADFPDKPIEQKASESDKSSDINDENEPEIWGTPPQSHEELVNACRNVSPDIPLRKYQEELAEPGLKGRNYIICAPTGCGKTRVAAFIMKHHLQNGFSQKVGFFAPTVALVRQQFQEFRSLLPRVKIDMLVGPDAANKPPLEVMIQQNDIVCMTPGILVNALRIGKIKTLEVFSLVVFDECHHTQRTAIYNQIMGHYMDTKLSVDMARVPNLPQVIGMTASLGVGEANIQDSAVLHIITVCSNLDAPEICVVRHNLEELRGYVHDPQEDMQIIPAKRNDRFASALIEAMKNIESKIKSYPSPDSDVNLSHLEFPEDRHKQRYGSYLHDVKWKLAKLPLNVVNGTAYRRNINACLNDLQAYQKGLIMHYEARAKDALKILEREFEEQRPEVSPQKMTEIEHWLITLYTEKMSQLGELSKEPDCTNPKLTALKAIILDTYRQEPGSFSILFTKTRESTEALKAWMVEDKDLSFLNPERLTGIASDEDSGMTSRHQQSVVTQFKQGQHKILIATSVAEEGLDIKACNVVFRHNYSTNEVGRVQSKGRARKEASKYITTTTTDRPEIEERDRMNLYREWLMKVAIEKISRMTKEELSPQIQNIQMASKIERDYKKEQSLMRESQKSEEVFRVACYNCGITMCKSSDLVRFGGGNHIVASKEFNEKISIQKPRKHGAPSNFQKLYKIFCKKCSHNWGVIFKFQGRVEFPVLKSQAIALFKMDGECITGPPYKRWDAVPVQIHDISDNEVFQLFEGNQYQLPKSA